MALTALVLAVAVSGFVPPEVVVSYFPGGYFNSQVRERLQRQVLTRWPGPTELVRIWHESELSEKQRVALLVGGAAYHDPQMLPLYREALASDSQALRQAAIYGYRELLADRLPNVDVTIDDQIAAVYLEEMYWMERTLHRHSLPEMWLQSALVQEDASLPGYQGVRLSQHPKDCFRALERLVGIGDLDVLVTAFGLSRNATNRTALVEIIEALTLSRFITIPVGDRKGWGMGVYRTAYERLDAKIRQWKKDGCRVDDATVLQGSLRSLGADVPDPLSSEACGMWLMVLKQEVPRWWWLAARRLYACGGPWYELSVFGPESQENRELRGRLIKWHKPLRTPGAVPGRRVKP